MTTIGVVFLLLGLYQLKHFLADYPLQGRYMLGKFSDDPNEWVPALLGHVAVHALFTFLIANFFFLAYKVNDLGLAIEIALFDAAVHFVMDRIKAGHKYLGRFKPMTAAQYVEQDAVLQGLHPDLGPEAVERAKEKMRSNTFFWWSIGFDQMVHHLTHYACIYMILSTLGIL